MRPEARQDRLLIQEVGDELVVYDQDRHRAHCLNRTAALVWRHCDGHTSLADLATLLRDELAIPADEDLVRLALHRLEKSHLLISRERSAVTTPRLSRREVVRRLGLVGSLAVLVPAIATLTAPTASAAASQQHHPKCAEYGESCLHRRCCPGTYCDHSTSTCVSAAPDSGEKKT